MTAFGQALGELLEHRSIDTKALARMLGTREETLQHVREDETFPCSQWVKLFVADLHTALSLTAIERSKLLIAVQQDRRKNHGSADQVLRGQ